jgi:hypothetical protein
MKRPHYKAPQLQAFKIFTRGQKLANGLYGYAMYETDGVYQNGILKNAKRGFTEVNRDYGNGTGDDTWQIIPIRPPSQ